MDPVAQGSFIPKQSLAAARRGGGMGLLTLLAVLIFVVSLLAAGGAFAYEWYMTGNIEKKDADLRRAEGAFNPGTIQELVRMDRRLTQARTLLQKHVGTSGIFPFLASVTLERTQFTSMDVTLNQDGSAALALSGTTDSLPGVALQADEFGKSKFLHDVVFSGISISEGGKVVFSVKATVDPQVVSYVQNLAAEAAPQ